MVHSFVFTLVRYKILALLIISSAFLIIAFSRQDWMREELRRKWGPVKEMIKASNATGMIIASATGGMDLNTLMVMIPDDATSSLMIHFGLEKTCIKITEEGFRNPLQLAVPVIAWCFDNKVFTNPEGYQLPQEATYFSKYLKDEIKGNANISFIETIIIHFHQMKIYSNKLFVPLKN